MEKNKSRKIKAIQEEIAKLPKEMQSAMIWTIRHWGLVKWLCKGPKIDDEEIEALKIEAKEKKDDLLFIFVHVMQVLNNDNETMKE